MGVSRCVRPIWLVVDRKVRLVSKEGLNPDNEPDWRDGLH